MSHGTLRASEAREIAPPTPRGGTRLYPHTATALEQRYAFITAECARLERMLHDLSAGTPLQYVLGYAYFAGHRLMVAPGVLIPRPETEELIELILQHPESRASQRLLDVGTGSGCITYALTAALPEVSQSVALEVSSEAAPIAEVNFEALRKATGREVYLWKHDLFALLEEHTPPTPPLDLIVSIRPTSTPRKPKR